MTAGDWFVAGMIVLQCIASGFYLHNGQYNYALLWACIVGTNACILYGSTH